MSKVTIIGVIAAMGIAAVFLASPLFYETEVNEPLPTAFNQIAEGLTYEKFVNMDDDERQVLVDKMSEEVKDLVMENAAGSTTHISEEMDDLMEEAASSESVVTEPEILKIGEFKGIGGHKAEGTAKILRIGDMTILRFEPFQVTNGPDLRVYLTEDGNIKNGIQLDKLKGSSGHQHYYLENIDTDVYDTVVIYCQPFGVYFGEAKLA